MKKLPHRDVRVYLWNKRMMGGEIIEEPYYILFGVYFMIKKKQ